MEGQVECLINEQVLDTVPKRIKELRFGVLTQQDIVQQSVVEITDRNVYDLGNVPGAPRTITKNGVMDPHMGTSDKSGLCSKCHLKLTECNGHFGHIRLALPVYHIGYFKKTIDILQIICKDCSTLLLDENVKRKYLKQIRNPELDSLRKELICRRISDEAKKTKICPSCSSINGAVRKVAGHPIKVIHNKYSTFNTSNAKNKVKPTSMEAWEQSFQEARLHSGDIDKHFKRIAEDMSPLRALNLFRRISPSDVELLGMDPHNGRPENFIWQYVPAPPVAIRPSVSQENTSTEDDITNKLGDIVHINGLLAAGMTHGYTIARIHDMWEFLQVQLAMYIDGNLPGLGRDSAYGRPLRGFNQRLKGKQGRFRGNLSGKRVDFSGRTVISPDPNLSVEEVAVPERVAVNMTYPEKVNRYNIDKLRLRIRNGRKHPGAKTVRKKNGEIRRCDFVPSKVVDMILQKLEIGDVVERHLEDGDIVLFNRQPSLHKLSILSHKVKVRPWRTFRLNECVCNPYNADFDGDEMNLHVPQTEEARTEAIQLMGVQHNLATPKNGTPIIAAIQDFISCAFLSSSKDNFFDRKTFTVICSWMFDGEAVKDPLTGELMSVELPPPTIWKPQMLWTGKQVWNVLMRPNRKMNINVNLDAKCKAFSAPPSGTANDMSEDDAYLVIRNSEVMCGYMDKATVGDGKKDSVFYVLMRDYGPAYAVAAMNRLAKLSARWLTNRGFSIGLGDVFPSDALTAKKLALVRNAEDQSTSLIERFDKGELEREAGCDLEMSLENGIRRILNPVRQQAADACFEQLSRRNTPLVMAKCGSKGSGLNVSQMIATVGQQDIGGQRPQNGFQDRTLPHFTKNSKEISAKGFINNSFFTGLSPTEFIFHAMSGREGLVDTAVKTAETGYMSRRLMKSLEDLSAQYDSTVRNSSSQIVQFQYGEDMLDPVDMEGDAKPVNFERSLTHAMASTWNNDESGLRPEEIKTAVATFMEPQRAELKRFSLMNEQLDYNDQTDNGVDQLESRRDFLTEVQTFIGKKADRLADIRMRNDMTRGDTQVSSERADREERVEHKGLIDGIFKLSATALNEFLRLCVTKYRRSQVEPGHAVGAVGAQSIGEPGTQMTLKTFHFAGVAGMSITQGVPRIKEIINASKAISTPVISCQLISKYEVVAGRLAKALIEKTYLRDIIDFEADRWQDISGCLVLRINWDSMHRLGLRLTMEEIAAKIRTSKVLKGFELDISSRRQRYLKIDVIPPDAGKIRRTTKAKRRDVTDVFGMLQDLRRLIPNVVIKGYPEAQRAVVKKDDKRDGSGREPVGVFVEGYGLKACMTTEGVDGTRTRTNSVMECKDVLGIEAARKTIIDEINSVMGEMGIDPRHMQLLADVMTYKGEVLGITRFGLAKMRDSVLQLASFEKTPDHLFNAAVGMKKDKIEGVSECIIMGQSMSIGTGAMRVVRSLGIEDEEVPDRVSAFEQAWTKIRKGRERKKTMNGVKRS